MNPTLNHHQLKQIHFITSSFSVYKTIRKYFVRLWSSIRSERCIISTNKKKLLLNIIHNKYCSFGLKRSSERAWPLVFLCNDVHIFNGNKMSYVSHVCFENTTYLCHIITQHPITDLKKADVNIYKRIKQRARGVLNISFIISLWKKFSLRTRQCD